MQPSYEFIAYCRSGFESECAQDIAHFAHGLAPNAFARTERNSGFVEWVLPDAISVQRLTQQLDWRQLIFARQWLQVISRIDHLPRNDRIAALLPLLKMQDTSYCDAWVESADTEVGNTLVPFCRAFNAALIAALKHERLLDRSVSTRLHLFFIDHQTVFITHTSISRSSPWQRGIPRLKFPRGAPSRSTLKLEEAFIVLLSEEERARWLNPTMTAVDLGAAPGGWTWQLVRRGMQVTAIDNGPLDSTLMESALVTHLREDGFRFQPRKPVHWLVCDMVEQPRRVAELIAQWLSKGWCEYAMFNLKLPMKKRYDEIRICLALIERIVNAENKRLELRSKQLYHDREEVTVFARCF